jgi:lipoprotein-anchoring transpeptidase ErfK/SrfK
MLLVLAAATLGLLLSWGDAWPGTSDSAGPLVASGPSLEPVEAGLQLLYQAARTAARESAFAEPPSPLQVGMRAGLRLAGEVKADTEVFQQPGADQPQEILPGIGTFGIPNIVLVVNEARTEDGAHWYQVLLPRKPNDSRGWVRADSLRTYWLENSIQIDVSERTLSLFERGRLVKSFPVGVGRTATPTPLGQFFITVRLSPPDPGGPYGPLAMGLSAYSEVLTWWAGGGQAAIHGTNNPAGIGTRVSNGCIRMHNSDVLALAQAALLGTPVHIVA